MIYGVVDDKSRKYYTYLGEVFDALDNEQLRYNWLITDSEIMAKSDELERLNTKQYWITQNGKQVPIPAPEYYYVTGEALTEIVRNDDSQWIWGVLSGFPKEIPLEAILEYPLPSADGYEGFWKNPPSLQHPLASLEIVPWDSSLLLLISKSKETVDKFKKAFPDSRDLSEYNAEQPEP